MLRISWQVLPSREAALRLEGQVSGPWVDELRRVCERLLAVHDSLSLDLNAVTFVDGHGVALCRSLQAQHVALLHCSPFVAEQLKG